MKLKTSSSCLLIIFVALQLASCAGESPASDIFTATRLSTPKPTATVTSSQTPTPKPTETKPPTQTPTPEVPTVTNADFLNFPPDGFFPVSHDTRLRLNDDIASGENSVLPSDVNSVEPVTVTINKSVEGMSLEVNCMIGVNCVTRYAVNDGSVNMIIWEMIVKGPDGNNMRVAFTTAPQPRLDQSPYTDYAQQVLQKIGQKITEVVLVIPLQDDTVEHSPVVDEMLNSSEIKLKLRDGIIDINTADEAVWLSNLSGH